MNNKLNKFKMILIASVIVLAISGCAKKEEEVPPETEWQPQSQAAIVINTLPNQVYVHVTTNLYVSPDSLELTDLVEKGTELRVDDAVYYDNGEIRFYEVNYKNRTAYIRPWYVRDNKNAALAVYDEALYAKHAERGDRYGGGDAGSLDYEPRDKNFEAKTPVPERAKTLYMPATKNCLDNVDRYINTAKECGCNALVVDLMDNTIIAYRSEAVKKYNSDAYYCATYSKEDFAEVIKKIKGAGLYVIGRMTAFRDGYLCEEHPEVSISEPNGDLKIVTGGYWPSAYSRYVWEYKVAFAIESATSFDLDEIQFDYVRFPDGTVKMEQNGEIDIKNAYGENRAQAIERFLMYAVDNIHETGTNVAADTFGETAYNFVAAYGQYWPAISNVVDVISSMPYPDHYERTETYIPWQVPYTNMTKFASAAAERQTECPTPAVDRTWIQCYDTKKNPATHYDATMVGQEIQALYDNGLTGGFLTWNSYGDCDHYLECKSAFMMEPGDKAP